MNGQEIGSLGNRNSQHSFAQIPSVNMARSKFNRSFATKDTFDFDFLVPIFLDEILPGDTCNLNVNTFARLATQVVPVMDNMYIDYFFFFVPNRLVWDNWEKFNGAQDDPDDSTDYTVPILEVLTSGGGYVEGTVHDHFGIPTLVENLEINALPFRAYNLIYNEWFRDQNLQAKLDCPKDDGPDATNYVLNVRAKKHDYFTSCLPWPQKGEAIGLPLGISAPVLSNQQDVLFNATGTSVDRALQDNPSGNLSLSGTDPGSTVNQIFGSETGLYTDLTEATAATINQFRQAIMVQSLLELDARGGTRYVEIIKAHFNVQSPDYRLQRPEFLSGGTTQINQHPVAQTSETNNTNQASLASFSTASTGGSQIGFSKSFTEHGYVIGLAQARGEVTYQQGLEKLWTRQTRYDFFWPKLQELGEQAVLNKEIYAQGTSEDDEVFGYQERYAEYRYRPSQIKGQFRSNFAQTLDVWHLAEEFESLPALNGLFIGSSTPIERSLAVTEDYPHLIMDAYFNYIHARPIMSYGVPATLGRF